MSHAAIYAGEAGTIEGDRVYVCTLHLSADEADAILATFDEQSASSPTAAECRAVARPVVIALRAAGLGQTP